MDIVAAVSTYVARIVTDGATTTGPSSSTGKMKILLLDADTVGEDEAQLLCALSLYH